MCGRYALDADAATLAAQFCLAAVPEFAPRYNIAPRQNVPAICLGPEHDREFAWLRWGLIPSWASDARIGNRLINARSETVAEKPAFRSAFRHRHCLVPASGYYEWRAVAGGKEPNYIHAADGTVLALAGLWESWQSPSGEVVRSVALLTTVANAPMRSLHARMPVVIAPGDYAAWLDPAHPRRDALLRPAPDEDLVWYPVSRRVNIPGHDSPDCLTRVS